MTEIRSDIEGSVWKVAVEEGQAVGPGDQLLILESMKMEIPVTAPAAGTVASIHVAEGAHVAEGDLLVTLS